MKWTSRWFLLSAVFGALGFALSWWLKDASAFTAIATVALGGGHVTNWAERRYPQPTMFAREPAASPTLLGGPSPGYHRPVDIPTDASPAFEREGDER